MVNDTHININLIILLFETVLINRCSANIRMCILVYESEQMGTGTPLEITLCYRIDKLLLIVTLCTCKRINIFTPKMLFQNYLNAL